MFDKSGKIKKVNETKLAGTLVKNANKRKVVEGLTIIAGLAKMEKMKLA